MTGALARASQETVCPAYRQKPTVEPLVEEAGRQLFPAAHRALGWVMHRAGGVAPLHDTSQTGVHFGESLKEKLAQT